ncbi:Na(+)/H(+) antiporter subunit B [Suttonella sp. R2A3]|uniref:MnhB domain-containing protein n=1 Tax=Suttonella sp. R2A3 TaxID=2908648 RepID=UPI001F3784F3|nr:MnhB domain-containing protein [Suttonella sp. R2A3]UJF24025.1 Na(+)/H(+) antiporter subunit B [Suttonella sp. R2A3]
MRTQQYLVLLATIARPLYWLLLLISIFVLLRGHNAPGGGFIGGLLASSATVLWALVFSPGAAQQRLPLSNPQNAAALGVLFAAGAGIPALIFGKAFLTHYWLTIPLVFTDYAVSTVLIFDTGVYLCVWGAVSGYALALLRISGRGGGV